MSAPFLRIVAGTAHVDQSATVRPQKPRHPMPPMTETHKNHRFRQARREVWRDADRLTSYWRARLEWHSALGTAQRHGIADAARFPAANEESRMALVDTWRAALVKQMLTPAPDLGAVAWKRAQFRAGNWHYSGTPPERIEHAIEADAAWLAAHPSKRSMAARRPMIDEAPVLHDLAET